MKKKSIFKNFFLDNYKVKIFSLICALFLWLYVAIDNQYEHTILVDLRVSHLSDAYILTRPLPEKVPVRFKGMGKAFLNVLTSDLYLDLDLSDITQSTEISLNIDMLKEGPTDKSFQPLRIECETPVHIEIDRFLEKKVPVFANLDIQTKAGFVQVGPLELTPDSVTVSGAQTVVEPIQFARTVQKSYHNLVSDLIEEVSLSDSLPEGIFISQFKVKFQADIQRIGEHLMTDIPVEILNVPNSVTVQIVPSTLSLKLQGGVDVLSDIRAGDITAAIDYGTRRRYGGRRIPAMITVPPEVTFTDVKPKDFELLIER